MNRSKRVFAGCAPAALASLALAVALLAAPAEADHSVTDFTLSPALSNAFSRASAVSSR